LLRKGNKRVIKEILIFKDNKSVISAKKELFLKRMSEQGNKHLIGPNPIRQQVNGSPVKVLMHLQPL